MEYMYIINIRRLGTVLITGSAQQGVGSDDDNVPLGERKLHVGLFVLFVSHFLKLFKLCKQVEGIYLVNLSHLYRPPKPCLCKIDPIFQ